MCFYIDKLSDDWREIEEMTVNIFANSVILILFAFSDNLSAENSKLSAESGLPGLSLLGSMSLSSVRKALTLIKLTRPPN